MDYKDYKSGVAQEHFWFKAKSNLIGVLLGKVKNQKDVKILDIGVGTGEDLVVIKRFGDVYAIDVDENALNLVSTKHVAEKKYGDICNIPYSDNEFDVVVCFDVLEHIEKDQKAVDEIYRVLKPGGYFVFTVPAFNSLYSCHDKVLQHFRRYNKKTIAQILKKFEKKELAYWFFFLFIPAAFQRICSSKSSCKNLHKTPPNILNKIFYKFLNFENWLISKNIKLPFGLTVYGIYKKPN